MSRESILIHSEFTQEFTLQMDASEAGLGTVLSQNINGKEHPTEKLFPWKTSDSVIKKEALAGK